MKHKMVGKKKGGKGFRSGSKPKTHIISDLGSSKRMLSQKTLGKGHRGKR